MRFNSGFKGLNCSVVWPHINPVKPKHVGAFIVYFNVKFNILKQINCALVGLIKYWITSECTVKLWKLGLPSLLTKIRYGIHTQLHLHHTHTPYGLQTAKSSVCDDVSSHYTTFTYQLIQKYFESEFWVCREFGAREGGLESFLRLPWLLRLPRLRF